jgi:hypothetical protein
MELTPEQEREVKAIMAEMDCPRSFRCYESKFEDLVPVEVFAGDNVVECRKAERSYCPMSFMFGARTAFCKCPLRRYVALHLGR